MRKLKPHVALDLFETAHDVTDKTDDVISTKVRSFKDKLFFTAYWTTRIAAEGYEPFEIEEGR